LPENPRLHQTGACFVTLESSGSLRGCIGSLNARRPLAEDVLHNARAAAFDDPRFPPLHGAELAGVEISISVLTPPEPFPVKNEADLLQSLRPGVDGLLLEDGAYRATFLPSVWEQLPTPAAFLAQHLDARDHVLDVDVLAMCFQAGLGDEFSASNAFEAGKVAMNVDGEWRVAFIAAEHPDTAGQQEVQGLLTQDQLLPHPQSLLPRAQGPQRDPVGMGEGRQGRQSQASQEVRPKEAVHLQP